MSCGQMDPRHFVENDIPNSYLSPEEMWSRSIFRGLSFHGINLRIMRAEMKMVIVVKDEVSFDEVSRTVADKAELS